MPMISHALSVRRSGVPIGRNLPAMADATLVYYQRHSREQEPFDSFDEALTRAAFLVAYGDGAPDAITADDRTVDGEALYALIHERERALGLW
jgi:hypothetical protein